MKLAPYLNFDGNCAEAMIFYAELLGGEIILSQTFGESPMAEKFPAVANLVMHMTMKFGDNLLMGSDVAEPFSSYKEPTGMSVQLSINEFDEAKSIFDALSKDGDVSMPFETTFWAKGFGMCRDRFGVPWMLNCD